MAATLDSRPTATTLDVEALVGMAWAGKIRVPHFQRDFRWGWEDVRRLFDSIVQGYPIGSLLLWTRKAPAQVLQLGALRIDAPESSDALWVVDGQQRLTSLANALHPHGQSQTRFSLAYDLRGQDFVRTPATEDPLVIPLPVLFDLQRILKWFAEHQGISDYLDLATNITRRIRQFEVPVYQVSQEDPRVLRDIFDRMNNYGKRLSRAEIFSALNAGEEADEEGMLTFDRIAAHIDVDLSFGTIDNDTVLAAVLARRGPEVRRDIRSEFTRKDDEGRDAAYEAGEEALRLAVSFLQNEAGVPHVSMLAYRYLLVVLTRVFAHHPEPDPRNVRLLRRWYWRAALAGPERFKGGTPNVARILCGKITEDDLSWSVQGLLDAVTVKNPRLPDLSRFSTNEAATKIILCAWWHMNPRNPVTAETYGQEDLAGALTDQQTARDAVRYLVPRRSVPVEYKQWAANRALMPGLEIDTKEISSWIARQPFTMSDQDWRSMLSSHAIAPHMAEMLEREAAVEFIGARQDLLTRNAREFLEQMCEWGFEDTPPLSAFEMDDEDGDVAG